MTPTQEQIAQWAREAGFDEHEWRHLRDSKVLALCVRAMAAQAEADAKLCEGGVHYAEDWDSSYWDQCCNSNAASIRANAPKQGAA